MIRLQLPTNFVTCTGCCRQVNDTDLCHHRRPTCAWCCMRYCGGTP